jgi:nucleotide-binding universal stress UspA family protein
MKNVIIHRYVDPNTILVATSLHDVPHLIPHAIAQAKLSCAKVLLVHVVEPAYLRTNPVDGMPFVLPNPSLRSIQGKLNQITKQFQQDGILCEPIALRGMPAEQISMLIQSRKVDRVIIGTKSAKSLDRILVGSVAEDLLHGIKVPVYVVGPNVRSQMRFDREPTSILVATSLQGGVHQSAKLAMELANLCQSHLTLLNVIPPDYASEEERKQMREQREDELLQFIREEAEVWCTPITVVREGNPAKVILEEAHISCADLIVLGAVHASRAARLFMPGIVHRVIAEAKVPVMTLQESELVEEEPFSAIA